MKLQAFFSAIAPYLEGRSGHPEVVRRLYPDRAESADAQRLAIYGAFCHSHRLASVDKVYIAARQAIIDRQGEAAWEELVGAYYQAHPMHCWELNENGCHLAAFLKDALPAELRWVAEVADVEWWEWQTLVAPDSPDDAQPHQGPMRLGSTVELRSYDHDVLGFLDREARSAAVNDEEQEAPAAGPSLVLFWRDRQLDARRDRVSAEELWVLKQVSEGGAVPDAGPLRAVLADLQEAGIVLGAG